MNNKTNIIQYFPPLIRPAGWINDLSRFENKKVIKIFFSWNSVGFLFEDNTYFILIPITDYDGAPELVIKKKENFRDKAYTKFKFGLITEKKYDKVEKKWREDIKKREEQEEKKLLEKLKKKYEGKNNAK